MTHTETGERGADPEKRCKILEGARDVFFAQGFAGASMDAIAKAAGVSKGTLYVYFENKESLFGALIEARRGKLPEAMFPIDDEIPLHEALLSIAFSMVGHVIQPEHVAFIRMVIGAVEKFPHLGTLFFNAGPRKGNERLAAYFERQIKLGRISDYEPTMIARHFTDLTGAAVIRWVLVCDPKALTPDLVDEHVRMGVDAFLRAYGPRST